MSDPVPSAASRRRWWRYLVAPLGVAIAIAIGALGFVQEFSSRDVIYTVPGTAPAPEAVTVQLTVQRVEASVRELVLQLLVIPRGAYSDGDDDTRPSKELVLETSSLVSAPLIFKAHERITARELRVPLNGVVSFYPFDSYETDLYVGLDAAGRAAPVLLTVTDHDPGFVSHPVDNRSAEGFLSITLKVQRSRSTYILAWFQLIVMWALGLSVLAGAAHIIRRRLGLVWAAMGWMAATLFALVGFRNAAPGLPPIGSLIDYCAFFWAEAIVTLSLVLVVVQGVRQQD